ncbi:hypothetical protein BHM03_00023894, partial [Ensete ventricosum]
MRNDAQKHQDDGVPSNGRSGGNGFFSVRSLSNYMRIVSSGASNVASNVRSAGASIVSSINRQDDAGRDQVPLGAFWLREEFSSPCMGRRNVSSRVEKERGD